MQAQTGPADPRRIPPKVEWSTLTFSGIDVAVGTDGNPVIAGWDSGHKIRKVNAATGATIWDRNYYPINGELVTPVGVAIGPDNNPVILVKVYSSGGTPILLSKLNGSTGAIIWEISYGESSNTPAIAIGPDGNPIVTSDSDNGQGGLDIRTAKFDGGTGALLWSNVFNSDWDYDRGIGLTSNGDPVVIATASNLSGDSFTRIIKYDGTTGAIILNEALNFDPIFYELQARRIAVASDGNLIITGYDGEAKIDLINREVIWFSRRGDYYFGNSDSALDANGDLVVTGENTFKLDGATGEILWSLTDFRVTAERSIAIGPDGKLFVTGPAEIIAYNGPVNNILWVARGDDMESSWDASAYANIIAIGPDNNPVVIGHPYGVEDIRTIKYDGTTGSRIWEATFDSGDSDNDVSVAVGSDGNPVVAGTTGSGNNLIIKYNGSTGAIIWNATYNVNVYGLLRSLSIGPDGNPVIAAKSVDYELRVFKISGASGAVIWNINSGAFGDPPLVAVGPDDNPVVADQSRLIKFDGTTGNILWNITDDTGNRSVNDIAIAPNGNPVVTGLIQLSPNNSRTNIQTRKYDGTSGGVIWSYIYPIKGDGHGVSMAIGLDSNPIVTEIFEPAQAFIRTIRLDGATGSLLSTQEFDTGDYETGASVAIGPDGNPVVLLNTYPDDPTAEFYIVKYLTEAATSTGTNTTVNLNGSSQQVNGLTVTYSQVSGAGATTFYTSETGPALPSGFSAGTPPLYFDINTTASFTSLATVCIKYDPARFSNPENIRLLHYENNAWVDVTFSNDSVNHVVCGGVTSFSPFVIVETIYVPPQNRSPIAQCQNVTVIAGTGCIANALINNGSYDPDSGDTITITQSPSGPYPLGNTTVTVTVTDNKGASSSCSSIVTVTNPDPVVTITGPPIGSVYPVNSPVNFTGNFSDNSGSTHNAIWSFDTINQPGTINEATGDVTATRSFTSAGVYLVKLSVNDSCGGIGISNTVDGLTAMVVVYDPNGGFVTGGGWINSPAGAYVPNPSLTGKASFGFVSKYLPGATVPTGNTEFQFKAGNLNFSSTSYEWLVVSGAKAQYKGVGTINGQANYRFMLTAIDGQINGGGGQDKFRIKIWSDSSGVVYDNQMNDPDSNDPMTVLGGGSIVIHKP